MILTRRVARDGDERRGELERGGEEGQHGVGLDGGELRRHAGGHVGVEVAPGQEVVFYRGQTPLRR